MENKIYLVSTVCAEYGRTHTHCSNMYSKEDLDGTDYKKKKLPARKGQTITIIDFVEDLGITEKWVTTITKVA